MICCDIVRKRIEKEITDEMNITAFGKVFGHNHKDSLLRK
jgi:hypothetical protein